MPRGPSCSPGMGGQDDPSGFRGHPVAHHPTLPGRSSYQPAYAKPYLTLRRPGRAAARTDLLMVSAAASSRPRRGARWRRGDQRYTVCRSPAEL